MFYSFLQKLRLLSIFILLSYSSVYGQENRKIKILPVPAIGYAPETNTYIGAVSLFTIDLYQDSTTRVSNAKVELNFTWNKQIIAESEWNYFFKQEKWFTKGRIHYSKYPDFYYGIGSNTPDSGKLLYSSNRAIFEVFVLKNINNLFFTGPNIKFSNYSNLSNSHSLNYPELKNEKVFGLGYSFLKDTRNNILTSTKGYLIHLNFGFNFSSHNYAKTSLDFRSYHTWFQKLTLASRLISEITYGNPPFYEYAILGGDKYVRGYNYGRYRDKNLASFQSELRFPVKWRFGLALFGGLSKLYDYEHWNFKYIKPNYGLGLRFLVDKKDQTNLRLDYALGENGNSGFYIAFGESF